MRVLKILSFIIVAVIIVTSGLSAFISINSREYAQRMKDRPILHLAPSNELNNIVDADYLATLKKNDASNIQIFLPDDFEFFQKLQGQNTVFYKRMNNDLLTGFVHVSLNDFKYTEQLNTSAKLIVKFMRIGIKNDYDFVTKMMYATKENVRGIKGLIFLMYKTMFLPTLGDEKNLKAYRYTNEGQRGYITSNILNSETNFNCHIFDNDNNYFELMIKTFNPPLKLEQICTILSTLKKAK